MGKAQHAKPMLIILLLMLPIIAQAEPIRATNIHGSLIAPQITINGPVTINVGRVEVVGAQAQEEAVTEANCETLCPTIWAIAGVSEPYELTANSSQLEVGDACRCLSGPGPKLRLDGSETP